MLNIYCCGGAASNIAKQITDLDMNIAFIDTSDSNLKGINRDHVFLVPDLDGAGKNRSISYEGFKPHVEDILIRFKPAESLNVVISSLSGGSGSVIGSLITKELISNGNNVIVIGVDTKNSLKEMDNTVKTLKSYQSISSLTKRCISLFYVDESTRKEADQQAIRFINLLSLLANKDHTSEFDTADLNHFINFNNVTDNQPTVSVIEVNINETIVPERNTNIVSSILLTSNIHSEISLPVPEYLSTCIVTLQNYKNEDIRIDNLLGKLSIIVASLETTIKEHQDNKRINKFKELEVVASTDDGMVL